jgi:vitamin K-dependent gamma-carboxylase-like protein
MEELSLKTTLSALARGWQAFFHAPCDARICAAIRIGYAAVILIHLAVLYPNLDLWFTDAGVLPLEAAQQIGNPYVPSLLWHLPNTPTVTHVAFFAFVTHAVLLLVGLLPRANAICVFVWLLSFQARNPMIHDSQDTALRLLGFLLIFLPLGRCWSINAWLIRLWKRRSEAANPHSANGYPLPKGQGLDRFAAAGWGLRLVQIEMVLIFLSTGLVKLGGDLWVNGTALYYVSRLDDVFGRFPVPAWAFDTPWVVALMTWAVIAVELLVPVLIWFRETRRLCLVGLLLFHLANEWTMNVFLFHWIMLVGWISFLEPGDFRWLGSRTRSS